MTSYVAKYDASGELIWARRAGGATSDYGLAIAVDGSGNSYVTGYFQGSATFGASEPNETTLTSAGSRDIFVVKMLPVIQRSSFQVMMVSPANASLAVAPHSVLNVNFNQGVDANTINTQTFTAYGNQTGIYTGAYTSTLDSAHFSAHQNFKPGEEIVVTLNAGVLAIDSTPLAPYSWGFRTAATAGSGTFLDSGQALGNVDSRDVALGDLDGDGDLDAFVVNQGSPAEPIPNEVWLNDGAGLFADSGQRLGNSPSYSVALGDLDRDGDLDAFVTNYGFPDRVWLNDGMGVFTDSDQELGENDISRAVALADIDSDGDLDAFVTTSSSSTNKFWLNDGSGVFSQGSQRIERSYAGMVAFGDLDNDGDFDLFVPHSIENNGACKVWLNDGRGLFSDSGQNLGSGSHVGVALGDLDADGDLDAFVINFWGEPNEVWLNDGSASFTDSGQRLGDSSSVGIALGDVDHDGDLDAFVSNSETSDYASNKVWLNDGLAHFSDSGQNLGAEDSSRMALGDLDGNGSLDAFVTNLGDSPANKVWLNAQEIVFLPIVQQPIVQ